MKQPIQLHEFINFLSKRGLCTSDEIYGKLEKYLFLIRSWSKKKNLISKDDLDFTVERHFLPSIFLFSEIKDHKYKKILDIGSGGGFPGAVLGIMYPDLMITLLDSSHNKCLFLKELSETMGISTNVICMRIEDYIKENDEKYDLIVSRAVSTLEVLWAWSEHLLNDDGALYALKGGNCLEEINMLRKKRIYFEVKYCGDEWIDFSDYLKTKCVVKVQSIG